MSTMTTPTTLFSAANAEMARGAVQVAYDDCGGKWCNKGLAYDLDVPTLNKAEADNVAKGQAKNGATVADNNAAAAHAAATASAQATAAADAAAGKAKADAAAAFAGADYKDRASF